jgi:Phospholipase_D-nuclease N-terminal/Short C-terminal domain
MSFWDIVWFIVIAYAFMTYLLLLFSIIGDLFRDQDTSGIVKAAWMFALIFVPFLSALVYLVVKGDGMAKRSAQSAAEMRAQQDAYIRETAGTTTPADQITQAKGLLARGEISEAEFATLKAKALA